MEKKEMNWLNIAIAIFKLLPALVVAIKAVEEAIPGKGYGEQKLAMIREILESIAAVDFEKIWPMVKKTIDILVATFNSLGIFKKDGSGCVDGNCPPVDCPDGKC